MSDLTIQSEEAITAFLAAGADPEYRDDTGANALITLCKELPNGRGQRERLPAIAKQLLQHPKVGTVFRTHHLVPFADQIVRSKRQGQDRQYCLDLGNELRIL